MTAWLESPRRLAAVVAAALAIALVVLLMLPANLPNPRSVNLQGETWSLPVPVTVEADAALSGINQRQLWAIGPPGLPPALAGVAFGQAPLTPPGWRIVGVAGAVGQLTLLIVQDAPPGLPVIPQALRVGDRLPGGARIVSIRSDGVGLLLHGQRAFLSTYPQ